MSIYSLLWRSVAPLLIGTFILRAVSGAGTVVLGLLLAAVALSSLIRLFSQEKVCLK